MKKVYGIGIGPGDKELITLKAHRLINECDYVFIPESKGQSMAGKIAEEYLENKRVVELEFPMGEDNLEKYKLAAEKIDNTMADGEIGVFLTLGDPMTYSTFIYLMNNLQKYNIETEIIPGITSYNASLSVLKIPAALKGDSFYLCDGDIDELVLSRIDTICILKVNKNKEKIIEKLEKQNFDYVYVRRCTSCEEKILFNKAEILEDDDYMSLIIGRRKNNG